MTESAHSQPPIDKPPSLSRRALIRKAVGYTSAAVATGASFDAHASARSSAALRGLGENPIAAQQQTSLDDRAGISALIAIAAASGAVLTIGDELLALGVEAASIATKPFRDSDVQAIKNEAASSQQVFPQPNQTS